MPADLSVPPELRVLKTASDGIGVEVSIEPVLWFLNRGFKARALGLCLGRILLVSTDSVRVDKTRMRRLVVDSIRMMNPSERSRQEHMLLRRFPNLPGFVDSKTVLLYMSHLPEEFETRGMIRAALNAGKWVACPRVDRTERRLKLFRIQDLDLDFVPGPFGIPEPGPGTAEVHPEQIEWALIPGIAFDRRGYRLGRGAGYYDRLLPLLRQGVPRFSMVLDPQWVEDLPTESHDQPVDAVIGTERFWIHPALIEGY